MPTLSLGEFREEVRAHARDRHAWCDRLLDRLKDEIGDAWHDGETPFEFVERKQRQFDEGWEPSDG